MGGGDQGDGAGSEKDAGGVGWLPDLSLSEVQRARWARWLPDRKEGVRQLRCDDGGDSWERLLPELGRVASKHENEERPQRAVGKTASRGGRET